MNGPNDMPARANVGIFESEEDALQNVVRLIADEIRPHEIWLFGSRAKRTNRPDSDFDLLVVTRDEDGDLAEDHEHVSRPTFGTGVGCDILPCPYSDFIRERESKTGLVREIMDEGVRIYGL